ncbi:hypothetical protein J6590_064389 [Homalodisca vitripennis]|nr:hypothetical protein J6590_064389 [Homalodisca vitripennis]
MSWQGRLSSGASGNHNYRIPKMRVSVLHTEIGDSVRKHRCSPIVCNSISPTDKKSAIENEKLSSAFCGLRTTCLCIKLNHITERFTRASATWLIAVDCNVQTQRSRTTAQHYKIAADSDDVVHIWEHLKDSEGLPVDHR